MDILTGTTFDFVGKRHLAYGLSGVLVGLGLLVTVQIARGKANLGIDFVGGTSVQIRFERPVDLGGVRQALDRGGLKDSEPQQFAGGDRIMVRVKRGAVGPGGTAERIKTALQQAFPGDPFTVEGSTEVGPAIGRDLQRAAVLAIGVALLGILAYIAVRFDFRFGVAATIATFHDVVVVLGVVGILGMEINLLIVTALLTIAGYSLTDTVVVYDRIRENLRGRRREALAGLINASINQVLSRTAITSLTTFLAVLAIFLLGGEVLQDFSFALLVGIIVGTYSSWFVASPIVYEWRVLADRRRRKG